MEHKPDSSESDIEKLAAKDLEINLLLGPEGLSNVAFLANSIPELRIVINHIAGVRIDGKLPDSKWIEGIAVGGGTYWSLLQGVRTDGVSTRKFCA
jgi:predicted TIM-barrel fold metal-dependent hydrolase